LTINSKLAISYLGLVDIDQLSRVEQAYALFLLQYGSYSTQLSRRLAAALCRGDWEWLEQSSLYEVFVVLNALYSYDETLLDGACMAVVTHLLLAHEETVGGPYKPAKGQSMSDANAVIAALFRLFKAPLPRVEAFLSHQHDISPLGALFLARTSLKISRSAVSLPRTPRERYAYALLFGESLPDVQLPNGSWHDDPICTLLALAVANATMQCDEIPSRQYEVFRTVESELLTWPKALQPKALHVLEVVSCSKSADEIATITPLFLDALKIPHEAISKETRHQFILATVYSWMALTVFDDIMDDNTAGYVPVGMSMYRRVVELYSTFLPSVKSGYFNEIDAANEWELQHCRFTMKEGCLTVTVLPRFGDCTILAKRAYGHIMAPLVTLDMLGVPKKQSAHVRRGFEHYLIARQLNDDLHDWKADVERGQISYVVATLLRILRVRSGTYSLTELERRLHLALFSSGLRKISEKIVWHCQQSQIAFLKSELLYENAALFHFVHDIESLTRRSLKTHEQQVAFMKRYGSAI